MKLLKLYSNDYRFKTVVFKDGLNLVLAKITNETSQKDDAHNLGKTKLIELIDFMLLKEINRKHFLKNSLFSNHIFFLEIELPDKRSLTIRRSIKKNTKISFKLCDSKYNDFTNETCWDYTDLPLTTDDESRNPVVILNRFLDFNVLTKYNFRKSLNYFLRTQNDYNDVFHLSKYLGSDSDWKPLLFELLGFNPKYIQEKYNKDSDLKKEQLIIEEFEKNQDIDTNDYNRQIGIIQIKKSERDSLIQDLNNLNFFEEDLSTNDELVEKVEKDISDLNSEIYYLKIEIENLKSSFSTKFNFNLEKVDSLFKQVNIYFSDQLKKSYSELIEFNDLLTKDRNNILENTIEQKEIRLNLLLEELKNTYDTRSIYANYLTETDTFKKYKLVQEKLINIEKEIELLNFKIEQSSTISSMQEKVDDIKKDIEGLKLKIQKQLTLENEIYSFIRSNFSKFVKDIIDKNGLLSIITNKAGNIEFISEILGDTQEKTSQSDGYTYKKILCACFDISLLLAYHKDIYKYFSFVFHDGCLESLDPRKQKKYLDMISEICQKNDIQYILTLLESDIPTINGKKYTFPNKYNISVSLNDSSESETLFGFLF